MKIGYARVSTLDQNTNLQLDALRSAGCDRIFEESASGARTDRPQLQAALDQLRAGDTLVVWRLDRLARSLKHLIAIHELLEDRSVGLQCLQESIDTTSSSGKLILHVFGALAEFERSLIRERTNAGLEAARARGIVGGRAKLLNSGQVKALKTMAADNSISIATIVETFGISKTTYYQYLRSQPG
jgi:DNA invertase Pin-like site-specific DNA recombinase